MHHFFADNSSIGENSIFLKGDNFNHAVNVLRIRSGEQLIISDEDGRDYLCTAGEVISDGGERSLEAVIKERLEDNHELPAKVILFQCIPKSDRMETIIEKAVELGVTAIVPVESKNCVVKIGSGKAEAKQSRWQKIAESAAKQSKRSIIPRVTMPVDLKKAIDMCDESCDLKLIPYEDEKGLSATCEAIINFIPNRTIGVFIGPEGGFDPMEVAMAKRHGILPISLGKRILRTDTAAIVTLGLIMIRIEIAAESGLLQEE